MLLFGYFAICSHLRSAELGVGASIAEFSVFLRIGRVWLLCFAQEVQPTGWIFSQVAQVRKCTKTGTHVNHAQARHGIDHRTGPVQSSGRQIQERPAVTLSSHCALSMPH